MKTTAELIAEFKAKGGTVQVIALGETAVDLTSSGWAKAIREPGKVETRAQREENDAHLGYARWEAAQQAHFTGDHAFGREISAGMHDKALRGDKK